MHRPAFIFPYAEGLPLFLMWPVIVGIIAGAVLAQGGF